MRVLPDRGPRAAPIWLTVVLMVASTALPAQSGPQKRATELLVLERQGSFFVGGEFRRTIVDGDQAGVFGMGNEDDIMVGQMYVQYQVPRDHGAHVPLVLVHGCCLSGKTWETTPDGRMGWNEYFVRRGRPVYVADQTSRGRSGFDAASINEARLGSPASEIPRIWTFGRNAAWKVFRFGPEYPTAFPDQQFPVAAIAEFAKQVIPDLNATLPDPNPTVANLASLAAQLDGAVLVGHSESGFFPQQAALTNPAGIRGIISIEALCPASLPPEEVARLAQIPMLFVWGDHIEDSPLPLWKSLFDACQQVAKQITDAGGNASTLHLPAAGLRGNSHMLMQDRNNREVADLLLAWVSTHVERRR